MQIDMGAALPLGLSAADAVETPLPAGLQPTFAERARKIRVGSCAPEHGCEDGAPFPAQQPGQLVDLEPEILCRIPGLRKSEVRLARLEERADGEIGLAGPPAIDRGLADAGFCRNRLERHARIAPLGQNREGGPQDRIL